MNEKAREHVTRYEGTDYANRPPWIIQQYHPNGIPLAHEDCSAYWRRADAVAALAERRGR